MFPPWIAFSCFSDFSFVVSSISSKVICVRFLFIYYYYDFDMVVVDFCSYDSDYICVAWSTKTFV